MANHFRTTIRPFGPSAISGQEEFRILYPNNKRTWLQAWILPDAIGRIALGESATEVVKTGMVLWAGNVFDLPDYQGELWGCFVPVLTTPLAAAEPVGVTPIPGLMDYGPTNPAGYLFVTEYLETRG